MSDYDRLRNQLPHRVAARRAYAAIHPDKAQGWRLAYLARNPEKHVAYWKVRNALKGGSLVKPDVCSRCGKKARLHGHHADYSKPLEVEWLCHPCHVGEHQKCDL
jgi:hypothetical protein